MNPISPRHRSPQRATLAALLLLATAPATWAQQAAPVPPGTAPQSPSAAEDEPVYELSPFEVTTEQNEGYLASSSLAGSRLNTPLRDISSPISVITPQFLKDTGATKVEDLLIYTTNTEVAGVGGNFYGSSATDVAYARDQQLRPQNQTRVRGLFGADLTRDFWQTNIPLDSYNVQGVEIQRGPNSVLYGLGSPAGIINYTLKTPFMADNQYSAEVRVDNEGSLRGAVDLNQAVAPGLFAVRLNALDEKHKYRQDGKYEKNERVTVSPRWTPKMGESVYTQFTLNYEKGRQEANRPTLTPPVDYLSNWYTRMNKYTYPDEFTATPAAYADYVAGFSGAGNNNWFDQHAVVFGDPNSSAVGGQGVADVIRQRGGTPFGTFHGLANFTENATNPNHALAQKAYYQNNPQAMAIINAMEQATGRAFGGFTGWQGQQVLDTSVFDYWNDDIAGPNNTTWHDFDALNFSAVQTYLNGRAGVEFVYDKQQYEDGYNRYVDDPLRLGVDINRYLRATRNLDGTLQPAALNPNFGRPFTIGGTSARRNVEMRENIRGTAFYKLNLEQLLDRKNLLTRIIGEQTFTGLGSRQRFHHYNEDWELYNIGLGFGPYSGESLWGLHYLSSAADPKTANGIAGLGISGLNAVHRPPTNVSVQILDQRLAGSSAGRAPDVGQFAIVNVDTFNADTAQSRLWTDGASDFKSLTTTRAFIWQSRLFGDSVVGLFGLRKDDFEKRVKGRQSLAQGRQAPDARNDNGAAEGRANPRDPRWAYDPANDLATSGTTRTYGVMVHSPDFINRRLPGGTRISVGYNEASNINPSDVGFDIFRQQIPAQSGSSKDYTVLVSTLDDRVTMRATWYKTVQQFASGPGPSSGNIGESLNRTLNGIMVEASYTGNRRVNTTPEHVVNKWFFGGNPAPNSSGYFTPGQWNNADAGARAAMLANPLLVRAAAATWGDPTTHLNANGSVVGQPTISDEEIAYRKAWFEARTDAQWQRPFGDLGPQLWTALQYRRVPNGAPGTGFTWAYTNIPSFKNTTDIESRGLELEVAANLTKNWRVSLNASKAEAENKNVMGDSMTTYYEAMKVVAKDGFTFADVRSGGDNWTNGSDYWHRVGFSQIDEWGDEGQSNNHQMLGEKWVVASGGFGIEEAYINAKAAEDRAIRELRKWRFNLVTSYDFSRDGALKGLGVGGAVRYQDKTNLGFYPKYIAESGVWVSDLDKPIPGPSEVNYDAWIYYRHKLTRKIDMTTQLNLRNLFSNKDLIPISANPDGTVGQYRLGSTFGWELSTRFEF